jgi:hypothetical protein
VSELKKGLIIQGPIISTGRTGKTANIVFRKVKEEHITNFNCIDNVTKIFNNYQSVFDHIIFVSWENQESSLINELKKNIPSECLVIIKDTTKSFDSKGSHPWK